MMPTVSPSAEPRAAVLAAREQRRAERWRQAEAHRRSEERWHARGRACGAFRLVLFAAGAVLAIQAARTDRSSLAWGAGLAWAAFAGLVAYHQRVLESEGRARRRWMLATESAARLAGTATGPGAGGEPPAAPVSDLDAGHAVHVPEEASHALASWVLADLGVEAERPSLHDLLDTTQSLLGGRRLRRLLRHPLTSPDAIRARQACVRELAEDRGLRDDLMLAFSRRRGLPQSRLPGFLAAPRLLPGGAFRIAVFACGVTCLPALLLAPRAPIAVPIAAASLAAAIGFNFALRRRAALVRDAYLELEPLVGLGREVMPALRRRAPQSPLVGQLQALCREFDTPGAPHRLGGVAREMRMLHLHEIGFLYGIVQLLTLWDLHWLLALESRVKRAPGRFERLAGALADLEAHVALGLFADEQAGVTFPEIVAAAAPEVEIHAGEHPLLACERAVANDVRLGGAVRLAIVTGSNMAGKSTFLRMVALNVLLAQMGLPVRARAMRLTPLALFANINVRDSIADGKSYFLVEVERVRDILSAAGQSPLVLGVFDELFRGTNARERLAASREIARHLSASGGLFLLATHDQALARLGGEEAVPGIVALHFRDEILDGRMVFPYRLHAGVACTHNAIRLLELAGYPEEIVRRARAQAEGRDRSEPSYEREASQGEAGDDRADGSTRVADTPAQNGANARDPGSKPLNYT